MTMVRSFFGNPKKTPSLSFLLLIALISFISRLAVAQNPNQTSPTTDSDEARLVNSIFQKLGAPLEHTQWNISGELCSGIAIVPSTNLQNFNPGLKCSCLDRSGTLCHVTGLRLFQLNLVGSLPDELWNLTYLDDLDLRKNYFTGPLPASISKLTRMQYLSMSFNALSGKLPKELGLLTELKSLGFSENYFNGSLPAELGKLSKLTQLYFGSCGVSGVIPQSFASLQNLDTMVGHDNQLTGPIPDFIGNWSKLITLRLQGNFFHGPIPSSFSKLTFLQNLRITNLGNATFTLDFIRNMTSLSTLNLRNNNISGSIPSTIGELQKLQRLDLSFNGLSGSIPDSLFNIPSLAYLFLGNNKLTGSLPQQKISTLNNIDLSYNELSGKFPSWVNDKNLQVNLVANNFTSSNFGSSNLLSGVNCLQRNFPCYRGSPVYYNFSINCGGPSLRSAEGINFEEDQTIGPTNYYVASTKRWAVSNGGLPADGDAKYTISYPFPIANTTDSEMLQTARVSAGSLRYFGLGLENGNYKVNLQFAESQIFDNTSWQSVGRRIFDIYIQGNRVEPDFDIKREAGGRSFTAVQRTYNVNVAENYLEIHLFWVGKGTCCTPNDGTYGPLVSAISATPDFIPTVSNIPPTSGKKNKTGLIVGIVVPVGVACLLLVFAVYFFILRRKRKQMAEEKELFGTNARPYTFSYTELRAATNDFDPANKLGEGGFGTVFKGTLNDKRIVAVKQLLMQSNHGNSQFMAEIATISAVQHRNLVKFYGCCIEGDKRLLVYEYLENNSLDQVLFGSKRLHLDWPTRFGICLGVARGLTYLHEESRVRIVHRDVKASNILLDSDFNPKISDFGLAKLYDDKMTHISTKIAGTIGYLAPEYALQGHLTEKADVFGFGVVALEIVSGRPNSGTGPEEDEIYLLELAWNMHERGHDMELIDPDLVEFDENEVRRVIGVALLCTQASPFVRPSMSRALAMLSGDTEVTSVTTRPDYLNDWNATSFVSKISAAHDSSSITAAADGNRSP